MHSLRRLDARTWRLIASFAAILIVNSAVAYLLPGYLTALLVTHEGEVAQEFLQSIVSAEKSRDRLFESPGPGPALLSLGNHIETLPGVVRVNIYSPDGFIRYASDRNFINRKFTDNSELAEAFEGHIVAQLEEVTDDAKPEYLALNRSGGDQLIEAYLPMKDDAGKIFAVVEFYRRPDRILSLISSVRSTIWSGAALGGAMLFIALALAMRRAD
jgi:two-component system, NtrC family, sensor histidine kinase HydH